MEQNVEKKRHYEFDFEDLEDIDDKIDLELQEHFLSRKQELIKKKKMVEKKMQEQNMNQNNHSYIMLKFKELEAKQKFCNKVNETFGMLIGSNHCQICDGDQKYQLKMKNFNYGTSLK